MYREASSKLVESFAMVAWSIWERQNRIRERQKVWGVDEVCARASEMLKEFHGVHRKIPRLVVRSGDVWWKPPALGLFKVNFDGAFFEEQACAGLGVVIRDSAGLVIGALSRKIRYPGSVDTVEALAARRAVVFAQELCLQAVEVEGDSLKVIQALVAAKPSRTLFGNVITDIHCLVASFNYIFFHVKREGNKLAYAPFP